MSRWTCSNRYIETLKNVFPPGGAVIDNAKKRQFTIQDNSIQCCEADVELIHTQSKVRGDPSTDKVTGKLLKVAKRYYDDKYTQLEQQIAKVRKISDK